MGAEGEAAFGFSAETEANIKSVLSKVQGRNWLKTWRPFVVFVHPNFFALPRNYTEGTKRLEMNLSYFLTNYLAVVSGLLLCAILYRPHLLVALGIVALCWHLATRQSEIRIGNYVLRGQPKYAILSGLSIAILVVFAGTALLTVFGVSSMVILAHAFVHREIVEDEMDGGYDPEKGGGGSGGQELESAIPPSGKSKLQHRNVEESTQQTARNGGSSSGTGSNSSSSGEIDIGRRIEQGFSQVERSIERGIQRGLGDDEGRDKSG